MPIIRLTDSEADALTELVNIAFGLTASKLSQISGHRVILQAPVIAIHPMADLATSQGEARVVDLARRLGVTHVTVNRTLARLQREGYVKVRPYRAIFLTDDGHRLAQECHFRHGIVVAFLRSLGIPEKAAEIDAEGIEHHVSEATIRAMRRAMSAGAARDRSGNSA